MSQHDELDPNGADGADGVDFALVAYTEEGVWQVQEVDPGMTGRPRRVRHRAAPLPR